MYNPEIMSRNLRQLRAAAGLSYAELSQRTGICSAAVWRLENKSDSSPRLFTVDILADFYGVSLDWLCGRTEKPPHRRQPVTGAWVKNNRTYHTTNGGICQMETEKTVTCHSDSYVYATAIESIRHDDTLDKVMMRDILRRLIADFDKAVIADKEKAAFEEACRRG